jgi:hypothetical protein
MTAQLNLAHRPPPRRMAPSGPAPRAPAPAVSGPASRGPPPDPPPGQPPAPPGHLPRQSRHQAHLPRDRGQPSSRPRRAQLVVTQTGLRRSTTLSITTADDSFERLIESANEELGLGLLSLDQAVSPNASPSQQATRLSAFALQTPLLASESIFLPAESASAPCVSDASLVSRDASGSALPVLPARPSPMPVPTAASAAEPHVVPQSLLLASNLSPLPIESSGTDRLSSSPLASASFTASASSEVPPVLQAAEAEAPQSIRTSLMMLAPCDVPAAVVLARLSR